MRGARVVLLAGPTASGKSALALRLAVGLGGEVVNADSMQVYRDLRVLTARPSVAEENTAPHRLYGVADGAEVWSVARWLDAARAVLAEITARGRPAIVCGGTGLYLRALAQGLSAVPPIDPAIRDAVRLSAREEPATLHRKLHELDPVMAARLHPNDTQRVARALEVVLGTGRSLADHGGLEGGLPDLPHLLLMPDRPRLHERIAARAEAMMDEGALAEVETLLARGLPPDRPVMRAIGVPELADHLAGRISRDEAVSRLIAATRRLAKRQTTWFRHQLPASRLLVAGEDDARYALDAWRTP